MQPDWFLENQKETTFHHRSSIFIGHLFLHELITKLQHWFIVISTGLYHPTFLQILSFTSPLAH